MPTSTLWRRPVDGIQPRGVSPARPDQEIIEKLSPEPLSPSSTYNHTRLHTHPALTHSSPLQGLGLSYTGFTEHTDNSLQPDHLFIDQNGGAHVSARVVSAGRNTDQYSIRDWAPRTSRIVHESRRPKAKGHTRSGSTIDDLASAAIATSPQFTGSNSVGYEFNGSPVAYNAARPATSYTSAYYEIGNDYGPPAKRVKSERLASTEWASLAEGHHASDELKTETMNEEAALLLSLRNEVNFRTNISPPAPVPAKLYYSPSQHRQTPPSPTISSYKSHKQPEPQPQSPQNAEKLVLEQCEHVVEAPSIETTIIPLSDDLRKTDEEDHNTADENEEQAPSITAETGTASETANNNKPAPLPSVRKVRRVKPQIQAEVCAECDKLQRETDGDDDATISWICCNGCERWFHSMCAGFKSKAEARSVDKFVCKACEPSHGQTTFVRKSSRARTAIDYAGLNQGLVKSSIDTSMHHYVQPIKDGKITFLPDDFARIRPEILTSEFMENWDGMKRPFVVPAAWNPRFGASRTTELTIEDEGHNNIRYNSSGEMSGPDVQHIADQEVETVVDCDQDILDMVMPRDLTVRKVAELYGPDEPVPVIDVKSQETKGTYTLAQWADYYELAGDKPIRNVISLEVSESRLGRLIRRPMVVRDLDLEDHVWDEELRATSKKRPVQFYCLMSVADSYTDFHIDFGGSSVYYHILQGRKTFFFIPPEDKYLKKYEEWCNSDTQNETFLGDLCNNNCTRVDLYPGDTAFIPAGWIHAVWTPEDSLVIGGNFLTRIDYEMQLKVANVERVTKVSPKFRYPFFQKVMWYALIKYLDEDPVPDEVIQEFQDDVDFVFLRANHVWQEVGELANDAEPGTTTYNARHYPKAEISGLSVLRDYLYRTARIHADLPVPDINKKQIDAVKASIPKGHGDPMMLIKIFAIWCAWKTGSVPVPEWVHTDAGGLSDIERKEKVRKPESFRLPGERSSLRKASQVAVQESSDMSTVTPHRTTNNSSEVDSDSGKKVKSGSRGSGLRVACEVCRKRRIKCRHKDRDGSPSRSDARQRSYSIISSEAPPTLAPQPYVPDHLKMTPESSLHESMLTSNLAQAALATLDSQLIDPMHTLANGGGPMSGKKSRSKACEECRKSKRRCVHDEKGRVDPAKAAEPSKPRGTGNAKRPAQSSDDYAYAKRAKIEGEADGPIDAPEYLNFDALIDPALMNGSLDYPNTEDMDTNLLNEVGEDSRSHDELEMTIAETFPDAQRHTAQDDIPLDPALLAGGGVFKMENINEQSIVNTMATVEATMIEDPSPHQTIEVEINGVEDTDHSNITAVPAGGSPLLSHSSGQPKQVARFTPEDKRSPSKHRSRCGQQERRASSAVSGQTTFTSVKSRRSSSNTSNTTHHMVTHKRQNSREASVRPVSRGSTAESDLDADEKFARELQASENGLRRRASVRA